MNPCCCGGASQSLHITHRVISKHNPDFMHASTEEFDKTAKKREYSGVGYLAEELSPPARHLTSHSAGAFSLLLSCDIENWSAVKKNPENYHVFDERSESALTAVTDVFDWFTIKATHCFAAAAAAAAHFLGSCVVESILNPALEWRTPPL